jgi:hypothetical protein
MLTDENNVKEYRDLQQQIPSNLFKYTEKKVKKYRWLQQHILS